MGHCSNHTTYHTWPTKQVRYADGIGSGNRDTDEYIVVCDWVGRTAVAILDLPLQGRLWQVLFIVVAVF